MGSHVTISIFSNSAKRYYRALRLREGGGDPT